MFWIYFNFEKNLWNKWYLDWLKSSKNVKFFYFSSKTKLELVQCKRYQCEGGSELPDPGSLHWIPQAHSCLDERYQGDRGRLTSSSEGRGRPHPAHQHQGRERWCGPIQADAEKSIWPGLRIAQRQCAGYFTKFCSFFSMSFHFLCFQMRKSEEGKKRKIIDFLLMRVLKVEQ